MITTGRGDTGDVGSVDPGVDVDGTQNDSGTQNPKKDAGSNPVDDTGTVETDSGLPEVEGVEVSHAREVRGVWIPTVFNISWPSRTGLSAETQKNELRAQLEVAKNAGLNTVYFQVRSEAAAFYPSTIEPWSRFLSGAMGKDPGWDPFPDSGSYDAYRAGGGTLSLGDYRR